MNALQKLAAKKKLTYMLKKAYIQGVAAAAKPLKPLKPQPSPEVTGRSQASTDAARRAKTVTKLPKNPPLRSAMGYSNVPKY